MGRDQGGGGRRGGMGRHVQESTKQSECTVSAHILGGFQSIRWKISYVVTDIGRNPAYHI